MIIINPGTGPVPGACESDAHTNTTQFAAEVRAALSEDVEVTGVRIVRPGDNDIRLDGAHDGRFAFTVTFQLTCGLGGDLDVDLDVAMPGLPLEKVNYGAREGDNIWDFPRLYLDGSSWVWSLAVDLTIQQIRGLATQHTSHTDNTGGTNDTQNADTEENPMDTRERRLGWGYNEGLPAEPIAAAWGCRALVTQPGIVDLVHNRQDTSGEPEAIDQLLGKLNGGLNVAWITAVSDLLRNGAMQTREAVEFTVLTHDNVVIMVNTKNSGGYLYVLAYVLADTGTDTDAQSRALGT